MVTKAQGKKQRIKLSLKPNQKNSHNFIGFQQSVVDRSSQRPTKTAIYYKEEKKRKIFIKS